eukprot:scaffold82519_cov37-Phaeocystis_antarctica.AAC.5
MLVDTFAERLDGVSLVLCRGIGWAGMGRGPISRTLGYHGQVEGAKRTKLLEKEGRAEHNLRHGLPCVLVRHVDARVQRACLARRRRDQIPHLSPQPSARFARISVLVKQVQHKGYPLVVERRVQHRNGSHALRRNEYGGRDRHGRRRASVPPRGHGRALVSTRLLLHFYRRVRDYVAGAHEGRRRPAVRHHAVVEKALVMHQDLVQLLHPDARGELLIPLRSEQL